MWLQAAASIRPHPFGMHPPSFLGHVSSLETSGTCPTHVRKSTPMLMAECLRLLAAICLGIDCPFFPKRKSSFNTVAKSIPTYAAAKHAGALGTGAEVCMGTGNWRPSVHAQGTPAPKCACAWGTGAELCMCMWRQRPHVNVQWALF